MTVCFSLLGYCIKHRSVKLLAHIWHLEYVCCAAQEIKRRSTRLEIVIFLEKVSSLKIIAELNILWYLVTLIGCSFCCHCKKFYILCFLLLCFFFIVALCVTFQNQYASFYALLMYHNKKPQLPMFIILYQFIFYAYLISCFTLLKIVSCLLHYF